MLSDLVNIYRSNGVVEDMLIPDDSLSLLGLDLPLGFVLSVTPGAGGTKDFFFTSKKIIERINAGI